MTDQIKELSKEIQQAIDAEDWPTYHPQSLYEPIQYMLSLGGKRMRSILTLLASQFHQGSKQAALPMALTIEYFHNFTLIHDDIMDQSPKRRGQPTVHEKWDETVAILSGDVLYTLSFQKLQGYTPELQAKLLERYVNTAREVCEGQQLDMDLETAKEFDLQAYLDMIRLKTAVLVGFSLEAGTLIAQGKNSQQSDQMYKIGVDAGLSFQLMDDYLDTFGDEAKTGKRRGNDIRANKKTYLLIHTMEKANPDDKLRITQLVGENPGDEASKVETMTALFQKYGADKACLELADHYYHMARQNLLALPGEEAGKKPLLDWFHFLKNREH